MKKNSPKKIEPKSNNSIKLMTYNLEFGAKNISWPKQLRFWRAFLPHDSHVCDEAITIALKEHIDILTLTEVDGGSYRTRNINQIKTIANHLNYNYIFFPTFNVFGFGNHGNGILSKYPIIHSACYVLPGKGEKRILGQADIRVGSEIIKIFVTHLAYTKKSREIQLEYLKNFLKSIKEPFILSGDFNTEELNLGFFETEKLNTFPSWKPSRKLDHIVYSKIHFLKNYVINSQESDHLPLVGEFRFEEKTSPKITQKIVVSKKIKKVNIKNNNTKKIIHKKKISKKSNSR